MIVGLLSHKAGVGWIARRRILRECRPHGKKYEHTRSQSCAFHKSLHRLSEPINGRKWVLVPLPASSRLVSVGRLPPRRALRVSRGEGNVVIAGRLLVNYPAAAAKSAVAR